MKKLLFLVIFAFCASALVTQAFAAPAQNSRQGGGASTKRVATPKASSNANRTGTRATTTRKATQQRATQQKAAQQRAQATSKAQERKEAQDKQFGLMPSELDNTNHNIFRADASAIKGARETEQALRYLPFVTIVNTAGFGSQFDLRGQGRISSNGVKLYINGVPANPVDNYNSPMPINTVLPQLIQEVSVSPGGGAVMYGSGAKGGTIDIITSKRQAPFLLVGAGYVNTMATTGNSFNAFAQAAENFGPHLKANAGVAGSVLNGPREDDSYTQGQAVIGAWYDIGWGQSVSADIDVFYGKSKTTPYNSLIDFGNMNNFMLGTLSLPATLSNVRTWLINQGIWPGDSATANYEQNRYQCLAGNASVCAYGSNDFDPDKEDRSDKGYGDIEKTQIRATGKLGWESQLTQKLKLNVDGFYSLNSMKWDKYEMNLPYFVLGYQQPGNASNKGYNWFLPRPSNPSRTDLPAEGYFTWAEDGQRADWHFLDQSGSKFDDHKFGAKAKLDWLHDNGQFFFGLDFSYEMSKKDSKSYLRQAIVDGSVYSGFAGVTATNNGMKYSNNDSFTSLQARILDKTDINVLTTATYIYERYDFNRNFSVGAGMRYELKNYNVKMTDEFEGSKWGFYDMNSNNVGGRNAQDERWTDYESGHKINIVKMERDANGNITGNVSQERWDDGVATATAEGEYSQNHDNFTFELAPVFRYSNTGSVYARGEFGYNAPPAWAMLRRIGIVWGASTQRDIWRQIDGGISPYGYVLDFDFAFEQQDLKNETYYTAELGWKEMIGSRRVPLGFTNLTLNALLFSANLFYTASQNEFFFDGDTWSGMSFGNYEKSRRMGVELAAEQYLFGGALGINESFTYLKAQKFDCGSYTNYGQTCVGNEWQAIPYTYDWKATLGAAVNISTFLEVVDVDVSIWLQNSIYGNQNVYTTTLNVIDRGNGDATTNTPPMFWGHREDKKLDPYLISDFGVSVGINKNMGVVTLGVKNVFDTFYYDYYNNDKSAVVNENRYVIGRGRTVFVEGTFRY